MSAAQASAMPRKSLTGLSGFLSFLQALRDPLGVAQRLTREHGDSILFDIGPLKAFLTINPEQLEEVLATQSMNFTKDKRYRSTPRLLGNGLLTADGELWRRQRKVAQPAFHAERISAYGRTMAECTEVMLSRWREGAVREVNSDLMAITLAIVGKTMFSADMADSASELASSFMVLLEHWNQRAVSLLPIPEAIPTPHNVRFNRAVRRLEALLWEMVRQRRESKDDSGDLLSMLLHAQQSMEGGMSDQQLRDEFVTMVLAGYETSANSISWTLHMLAQHPEVEARVVEELQAVLGGRTATAEDAPRLRYLDAVLTESLRLYPPVWGFGREVINDCEIGGTPLRAGTQVLISPYLNHRLERYFPEPERFHPDRWLDGLAKTLPSYLYIPFGRASRMCIGRPFALLEAVVILSMVLQRFKLTNEPGTPVIPQPGITLRPKFGLPMRLSRRE